MRWSILLSNGVNMSEDTCDMSYWKTVLNYCKSHDLEVVHLKVDDRKIDPNADMYFVINQVISFAAGSSQIWEKGIGSVRLAVGKTRVEWYDLETREHKRTEVRSEIWNDIDNIALRKQKKK